MSRDVEGRKGVEASSAHGDLVPQKLPAALFKVSQSGEALTQIIIEKFFTQLCLLISFLTSADVSNHNIEYSNCQILKKMILILCECFWCCEAK